MKNTLWALKIWRAKFRRDKTATPFLRLSLRPKIVELIIDVESLWTWWDLIGKRSQCTNYLHYSRILCNYHNQCASNENKFNCLLQHLFTCARFLFLFVQSYIAVFVVNRYWQCGAAKGLISMQIFVGVWFSESKWLRLHLET